MKKDKEIIIPEDERQIERTIRILTRIHDRIDKQLSDNFASNNVPEARINNEEETSLAYALRILKEIAALAG